MKVSYTTINLPSNIFTTFQFNDILLIYSINLLLLGITCCGPVPDDWDWNESQDDDTKLPNFSNFDDWVESHEGRQAMSSFDESKWPKCGVCGARSNCETSIRRYWEPCCICDAFICESHKAKYCSSKCRAEGRKK